MVPFRRLDRWNRPQEQTVRIRFSASPLNGRSGENCCVAKVPVLRMGAVSALASAAAVKGIFSNRAFGSSLNHHHNSHIAGDRCLSSGSSFSSQSLLVRFGWTAARMCRIGCGAPSLVSHFEMRSSHFRRHPQTSSGRGTIPSLIV